MFEDIKDFFKFYAKIMQAFSAILFVPILYMDITKPRADGFPASSLYAIYGIAFAMVSPIQMNDIKDFFTHVKNTSLYLARACIKILAPIASFRFSNWLLSDLSDCSNFYGSLLFAVGATYLLHSKLNTFLNFLGRSAKINLSEEELISQSEINYERLKKLNEIKSLEAPFDFCCPITGVIMTHPHLVKKYPMHVFEYSAIKQTLESSNTNPINRQPLSASDLEYDSNTKMKIESFLGSEERSLNSP